MSGDSSKLAKTSRTVSNTLDTFKETKKVYEQGKQYYDALKSVNHLVKDARKVQKTLLLLGEITDIYVNNFQLMLSDKNFRADELTAIAHGYAMLVDESADIQSEPPIPCDLNFNHSTLDKPFVFATTCIFTSKKEVR